MNIDRSYWHFPEKSHFVALGFGVKYILRYAILPCQDKILKDNAKNTFNVKYKTGQA